MGWETTMSDKFNLITLPPEDDLIENRIWGIYDLMIQSNKDYVPQILQMLLEFIGDSYEGECIEQCLYRIQEGKYWWVEGRNIDCIDEE